MLSLYSKEEWLSLTKKAGSYSTELYFPIAYSVDAVPLCPQRLSVRKSAQQFLFT